jgi:hypothetical protein
VHFSNGGNAQRFFVPPREHRVKGHRQGLGYQRTGLADFELGGHLVLRSHARRYGGNQGQRVGLVADKALQVRPENFKWKKASAVNISPILAGTKASAGSAQVRGGGLVHTLSLAIKCEQSPKTGSHSPPQRILLLCMGTLRPQQAGDRALTCGPKTQPTGKQEAAEYPRQRESLPSVQHNAAQHGQLTCMRLQNSM